MVLEAELGCSPIKAVRELGSERRETVRSLSVAGAGNLRGAVLTRIRCLLGFCFFTHFGLPQAQEVVQSSQRAP